MANKKKEFRGRFKMAHKVEKFIKDNYPNHIFVSHKPLHIAQDYCKLLNISPPNKQTWGSFFKELHKSELSPFNYKNGKYRINISNKEKAEIFTDKIEIKKEYKFKEQLTDKEQYRRYLKSAKWKSFKKELIKVRGHKCEDCGEKYRPLDGHHVTYKRLFNELPEDIKLLCHPCHKKTHNI